MRHVRKGELLFRKGDEVTRIYFVAKGQVRVNAMQEGKTALHEIRGPRSWLAEDAMSGRRYHRYTVVAATGSDVVAFACATFCKMLEDNPVLNAAFMIGMANHLDTMHAALDDYLFNPADKRAARMFLSMFVGSADVLPLEMTPTRLGELIGATRQTAHTIINRFRAKGMMVKKGQELYHLHKGPLQTFLAAKNRVDDNRGDRPSR